MGESIEEFVSKLHAEGVEAGRKDAEQITAQARQEAERIVSEANQQAEDIVRKANTEADGALQRGQTELRLAARDSVMKLRQTLAGAIDAVLARATRTKLKDPDFLGKVVVEVVRTYAEADREGKDRLTVNVPKDMAKKLTDWALHELGRKKADELGRRVDLKTTLTGAGFEYKAGGGTVEVTPESVVELLSQLVGPSLRELLAQAAEPSEE